MNENMIDIDTFINDYEEKKLESDLKEKKIERIQIGLIIFLIVIGTLTYFFGYDLLEPFIKID